MQRLIFWIKHQIRKIIVSLILASILSGVLILLAEIFGFHFMIQNFSLIPVKYFSQYDIDLYFWRMITWHFGHMDLNHLVSNLQFIFPLTFWNSFLYGLGKYILLVLVSMIIMSVGLSFFSSSFVIGASGLVFANLGFLFAFPFWHIKDLWKQHKFIALILGTLYGVILYGVFGGYVLLDGMKVLDWIWVLIKPDSSDIISQAGHAWGFGVGLVLPFILCRPKRATTQFAPTRRFNYARTPRL